VNSQNVNIPLGKPTPNLGRRKSNGSLIWRNERNSPFLLALEALIYYGEGDYTILQDLIDIGGDVYAEIDGFCLQYPYNHILIHASSDRNKMNLFELILNNMNIEKFEREYELNILEDIVFRERFTPHVILLLVKKGIKIPKGIDIPTDRLRHKLFKKIVDHIRSINYRTHECDHDRTFEEFKAADDILNYDNKKGIKYVNDLLRLLKSSD